MTYLDESYPADLLVAPGPFALNSLAPATAVANTAAIQVSANGTNFTPFTRVVFDGQELPTILVGNTQVRFTAPSHATGVVNVYVRNGGSISNTQPFTYTATAGDQQSGGGDDEPCEDDSAPVAQSKTKRKRRTEDE